MSVRRVVSILAVALLTSVALTSCGGSDKPDASSPASTAPTAKATGNGEQTDPDSTGLERPRARATISPTATLTAVPGASQLAAPREAPRTIQGFPVPPGAKVKDPGAFDQAWQFDIHTDDPAYVLAFYERVLPQMGYQVRLDVTYTVAYEKVRWDLVFDGRVSGSMAADRKNGVVFVVVNPPGQPAFAGDE